MNFPSPKDFTELIGALAFVWLVIFAFLSLSDKRRDHSLKILGIASIICLSLFAKNAAVFFAGVFIIATAITSIEFLENLAAIISRSKEYFE